ncbi:MerR family transcriptional regulator [Paraburkholderia eburnea]|uniref:MerR family transcriptional regulator n=2 Tax=Paraburkholderia eburnea TaxID=1189126 RepID=A0A2S4M0P6_9BURK|nr:MerR family transcriptional regulator [Paraburkholderia eburnea]PRZ22210.1 MerR family transcriptional regulator [Paraburkholderia eburnea]
MRKRGLDDNVNVDLNDSHAARPNPAAAKRAPDMNQYTITELAREFDVTPRAIRFYEDQGLLAPSREGAGGLKRVFSGRDRTRLRLTLRGKRLGFTLNEIRALLDLYESPTDTLPQLQAFLETVVRHREILERQRDDLDATLEDLAQYEAQARVLLEKNAAGDVRQAPSEVK